MAETASRKSEYIPLVTDVAVPGDPEKIRILREKSEDMEKDAAKNLQRRISEVESAIGQDEMKSPSRAHAIRAEDSL